MVVTHDRIRPQHTPAQTSVNRYIRSRTAAPDRAEFMIARAAGSSTAPGIRWCRVLRVPLHALAVLALLMFPVSYGSGGASAHTHSLIQMFMDLSSGGLGAHHHLRSSLAPEAAHLDVFSFPGEETFVSTQADPGTAPSVSGTPGAATTPATWVKSAPGSSTVVGLEAHRASVAHLLVLFVVAMLSRCWSWTEMLSGMWPTPATPPPKPQRFGPGGGWQHGELEASS
ncbi:MAG: hypothetical protein U0075_04435 [Thermomicrobiales bacterium]